jgi:hypothetical protein
LPGNPGLCTGINHPGDPGSGEEVKKVTVVYKGTKKTGEAEVFRIENGNPFKLSPEASRKIYDHSSDFEWSYTGSGPAQLALALLLDVTGEAEVAELLHQRFKEEVVAGFEDEFLITADAIWEWVKKNDKEVPA